jgi:hypothetical protein
VRAVVAVLCLAAACTPFAAASDPASAPPSETPPTGPDGGGDAAPPATPDGGRPVARTCGQELLTASTAFDNDLAKDGWKEPAQHFARITAPYGEGTPPSGPYGHFAVDFEPDGDHPDQSDGSTMILSHSFVTDPAWARLEWDGAILALDPYSAAGCTLSLESVVDEIPHEDGRIYLSSGLDAGDAEATYANLDAWWITNGEKTTRSPALPHFVRPKWQHIAIDMTLNHTAAGQTVSYQVYVDGTPAIDMTETPWSPSVASIRARCGALYTKPAGSFASIDVAVDNVVLSVCPAAE